MCQAFGITAKALRSLLTKLPFAWESQVVNAPSSRRQTMSSEPSPLKSPVPSTRQLVGTSAQLFVSLLTKLPFGWASQVVNVPLSFRQIRSSRPSPLKSPTPSTFQLVGTTSHALESLLLNVPFGCDSQFVKDPLVCRQTTSARPSPLKSPVPTTC